MFARHEEYVGDVRASPAEIFSVLDDQLRLSAHMTKRSWKMGWGKMDIILDLQGGHAVASTDPSAARVRVDIDYDLPRYGVPRVLGLLFGRSYARWCTRKMVKDAQRITVTFARPAVRVS